LQKLIAFIVKNLYVFIFLFLEILSLILVSKYNEYPSSVMLSSANAISGSFYEKVSNVTNYFGLQHQNDLLSQENADLRREILMYQSLLDKKELSVKDTLLDSILPDKDYTLIPAKVIDNNTNKLRNFMTLNKGSKDGIAVDMGVLTTDGVAGIVCAVSDHFSVVISLLNPQIKVSCLLQKSEYVGSLVWDGDDITTAKLEDISAHLEVADGDTVVTSGFSSIFPRNIPVGVIEHHEKDKTNSYHDIDVRLFTNFKTISHVKVLDFKHRDEYKTMQDTIQ